MSNVKKKFDVIYAGNYTKDTIITPDGIQVVRFTYSMGHS